MKGIVIYDTSYGSTKIIAETISGALKESGIETDLFKVGKVKQLSAREYSFLVLGSPTRFGTMSFAIRGLLGKVNAEEWTNKPFIAFDTEMLENIEKKEGNAAEKIAAKLKDKGMNQLLPVLQAVVAGLRGPLKEGETERAKIYAREIATKLKGA
jgi:menaquinone-dependent protoporphyrinogen IX oxidase